MVLTSDEFRDVFDNESEAEKYAEAMNGNVVPVYYLPFEEYFLGMDETDGEFIGWEIEKDGSYYEAGDCILETVESV